MRLFACYIWQVAAIEFIHLKLKYVLVTKTALLVSWQIRLFRSTYFLDALCGLCGHKVHLSVM